jgi:aspartate/methionine/tyrosine aminotransferase
MDKKLSPSMFIGVKGNDIISFGSGQPDLEPPREVYDRLENTEIKYNNFEYGLIQGNENLREALSKQYPDSDKDSFVVTNGASEALDLIFRVIGEGGGKKVLVHKPYYYSYPYLVKSAGMEPIYVETINGKIDIKDFREKVKECDAVLINSPSNPTGRIQDIETLKEIEEITKKMDIPLISDEVYKDLIYERDNYFLKGPHVITVNSFSKTFSMCGFRIGYLYSNDKSIVEKIIALKTHTSMNTNTYAQEMALAALNAPKEYISKGLKIWKERRDLICDGLSKMGIDFFKPEGTFYVLLKVENPEKVVWDLYNDYNVITYLGEWFGAPGYIRMSYALDKEKIKEGLRRIKEYLGK